MKIFRVQSEFTSSTGSPFRIGPIAYRGKDCDLYFDKDNNPSTYFISIINAAIADAGTQVTPEVEAEWINNLIVEHL